MDFRRFAITRLTTALAGPRGPACASFFFALFLAADACGGSRPPAPSPTQTPAPTAAPAPAGPWQLSWSDEFNGDGPPDRGKWVYDLGGSGWGNNELESYTDRPENVVRRGGMLVITARKETFRGSDGTERPYTSARLKTQGTFSQAYGKFEARMRIPRGQGIWPAFWLLGDNISSVGWPTCGEIDIMENIGKEPNTVHGTMHGPGYSGGQAIGASFGGPVFADDFHTFTVEWEPNVIRWYVDGTLYETRTPADLPAGAKWVFDAPMFILVNLAVGGDWPGNPDGTTSFPQELLVDYVRVYSRGH
jgi:beta-glucanase (GH16 family)